MKKATALSALLLLFQLTIFGQENALPSLHLACLQGNTGVIGQHIKAGTNLNEKDMYGSTPLIIAVTFNKREAAEALLEAGADMNTGNNEGSTPLHIAALFCYEEIVKTLLDYGADRFILDNNGAIPVDIASAPFEGDRPIYDRISAALTPLGLKLDYEHIKKTRPVIEEALRPEEELLSNINYKPAERDDWKTSIPEEQGLDPALVAELYYNASKLENIKSLLIVKNGYLIAEDYFNGGSPDKHNRMASVTKSVISALTGISAEKGALNTDGVIADYFPEMSGKITDPRKNRITIKEMLQMRGGFPWEETDSVYWKGLLSGVYVPLIEEFPLRADPGTAFNYSNLTSNWLGIILARANKTDLRGFAETNLFKPLGIKAGEWERDAEGNIIGCGTLHLTARDAARFGQLYLNGGKYNGRQVVPAEWVKESLQRYSFNVNSAGMVNGKVGRYLEDVGYGYQWWSARVGKRDFNLAWGHGGQFVILLKDLNMVMVITSYPYHLQHDAEAWRHEKASLNLAGRFIRQLEKSGL